MNKNIFLVIILGMVLISFASAGFCYQESANTTNQTGVDGNCGLSYTGTYQISSSSCSSPASNYYDGDWDSGMSTAGSGCEVIINYTKALGSNSSSIFSAKPGDTASIKQNYSIPLSCWNANSSSISFKTLSVGTGVTSFCKNSTSWVNILTNTDTTNAREEAMWWDIDLTPPTFFINGGNGTQSYRNSTGNHTINYTITDTNLDTCWLNYNSTNITIPCTSGAVNTTNFTLQYNLWNATLWANDTVGNTASQFFSWTYTIFENNRTYTANTYETASETFVLNFSSTPSATISTPILWYNGTAYPISNLVTTSAYNTLTNTLTVPANLNQTANSTYNFFWSVTIDGTNYNTSTSSQVSQPIILTLCDGAYTTKALNFSARNETIPLTGISSWVFGGFFQYGTTSGNLNKNYSLQNNTVGAEVDLCISPASATIYVDADIDYTATGFLPRSYYLRNALINSSLQNVSLWLTTATDSTDIIASVKNQFLEPQKNYVIQLMRYYPGYGVYYLVETAKTDDFGQASLKIVQNDVDYKMLILDENGVLIHTTSPMRIICTATPCVVEIITGTSESTLANVLVTQGITSGFTYNNLTGYLTFTYSDPTGLTSNMRLQVVQVKSYANIEICNSNSTGSAGILTCSLPDNSGSYLARAFRSASPETAFNTFLLNLGQAWQTFGKTGLFWSMIITIVMFFVGLTVSPIIAAILSMASIILFMFLGIVAMPMGLFIALMIIFIIYIIKIRG